jgi:uncharacterized membrane protein
VERIPGVDVARGLAVLGMVTAHVGAAGSRWTDPWGWLQVADGRSAATFATLAGVSAALLSGGPVLRGLGRARVRIALRAAVLGVLGLLLVLLGTPVVVILPGYAVMFALLTLALGLRSTTLASLAAVAAVVGPRVVLAAGDAPWRTTWPGSLIVGDYYPAAVWMTYLLAGLAVGRTDLRDARLRGRLALAGLGLAVLGYGAGAWAAAAPVGSIVRRLLDLTPHSSTTAEVVGNLGVVLLVLAACVVAADALPRPLAPLAATGALALTAYVGHVVVIAALGDDVVYEPRNGVLLAFLLTIVVACWAWRRTLGRGPLERALHAASTPPERVPSA